MKDCTTVCPLFINLSQSWYPDVVINRHDISGISGYNRLEFTSKYTVVLVYPGVYLMFHGTDLQCRNRLDQKIRICKIIMKGIYVN